MVLPEFEMVGRHVGPHAPYNPIVVLYCHGPNTNTANPVHQWLNSYCAVLIRSVLCQQWGNLEPAQGRSQ